MKQRTIGLIAIPVVVVGAVIVSQQRGPAPLTPIGTSSLAPGLNCRIGVASSKTSDSNTCREYSGIVAQVTQQEVLLNDAVYQEISSSDIEIRKDVGVVRIPVADIVVIHHLGRSETAPDGQLERIGVQFR